MAKIILVSQHVHSTSWQLALALKAQQHEVVLLTSFGENPPGDSSGIEIMSYFKKWSLVEGLRIIPGLFGLQPQILHLVLDHDQMSPAQMVLSAFARTHPTCVLTTSLLDVRRGLKRRNPVRYLIEESDIVTCPTVEVLGQLRGLDVRSTRQGRGILAPVLNFSDRSLEMDEVDSEQARLFEQLREEKYFVVPFRERSFNPESDRFERIRTLAQKHKVVLWGSYSHWSLRDRKKFASWMEKFNCGQQWLVTGSMPAHYSRQLLKGSAALVLAGQNFSPVEMTEYYMRAIQASAVLVLDSKQTSVHADLWRNAVNCWVLNRHHMGRDLVKLLAKQNLRLPEQLSEELALDRHLIDSSMNELNRLYNRALGHLR